MPTYEYLCNECEHAFEAVQSFTEAAIEHCPKCDGRVRKVYNNVGVVFKGSGFYVTDYKKSGAPDSSPSTPPPAATPAPVAPAPTSATTGKSEP